MLFPRALQISWLEACEGQCFASVVDECLVVPKVPEMFEGLDQFFLRSTTNMATLVRDFKNHGFEVAAEVVSGHCYTTFASWRWNKLWDCCKAVDKVLGSFTSAFNPTPFRAGRDQVQLRDETSALSDRSWQLQLKSALAFRSGVLVLLVNVTPTSNVRTKVAARFFGCDGQDEGFAS